MCSCRKTMCLFTPFMMLAFYRLAPAQLTQTQQVYSHAITVLFKEDVDVSHPRIVYVLRSSDTLPLFLDSAHTWSLIPDTSYRARSSDSGRKLVWGDVPRELRVQFPALVSHETEIRSRDLPPEARLVPQKNSKQIQVSLSPIAFTPDSGQALVYLAVHCGDLCGGGDIVYLRKDTAGSWSVAATFPLWRS